MIKMTKSFIFSKFIISNNGKLLDHSSFHYVIIQDGNLYVKYIIVIL